MRSEPALPVVDHTVADNSSPTNPSSATTLVENGSLRAVDDRASIHSTSGASSRSMFWPPSLRRRPTDRSAVTVSTATGDGKAKNQAKTKEKDREHQEHRRRPSDEDDDMTGLGFEVEMELQKQSRDGGEWGIGDEARMGLE